MTDDDALETPAGTARIPSPTPPPPDVSLFDAVTGSFAGRLDALAGIGATSPPRPIDEGLLTEDDLDATETPRPPQASSRAIDPIDPVAGAAASSGSLDVTVRQGRGRIPLRIPDDAIPASMSPQPPPVEAVEPSENSGPQEQVASTGVVVQVMRIISVGKPAPAKPTEPLATALPIDTGLTPPRDANVEVTWSAQTAELASQHLDYEEVEPEPDDDLDVAAYVPPPVALQSAPPPPSRARMASVTDTDLGAPFIPAGAVGPLPPIEPPRPRMASVPVMVAPQQSEPDDDLLEEADVAPDSLHPKAEADPTTERVPSSPKVLLSPPPPPQSRPTATPTPPQPSTVVLSPEDILGAVTPPRGQPAVHLDIEEEVHEVEEVQPAPPPPSRPAKPPRRAAALEDRPPRVRPAWEEVFTDDFVRAFPRLTQPQVDPEVTFIENSLGVSKGGVILDLGCGAGQHAVEYASRGYNIIGYDLSITMLALASDEAQERGQKINFLQGDMRDMAFQEMFDGVYSWATSFGFFDEEKNISVIQRVHRALRQSGMFLLDVVNRDFIVTCLPSLNWFEGDGCVCIDDAQFDSFTSRLRVKRTLMREDGKSRDVEYSVRLYGLHEIGKILHDCGFKVIEVSGHPAMPGAYFGAESPRMIILAERK